MSAYENVLQQQKRSQFGASSLNTDAVQDQLSQLQGEQRRQAGVKSGQRVMNQQSSIGSFANRGSQGIGGAKYPTR